MAFRHVSLVIIIVNYDKTLITNTVIETTNYANEISNWMIIMQISM